MIRSWSGSQPGTLSHKITHVAAGKVDTVTTGICGASPAALIVTCEVLLHGTRSRCKVWLVHPVITASTYNLNFHGQKWSLLVRPVYSACEPVRCNGVIAKMALRDLCLHFKLNKLKLHISQTVKVAQKFVTDICRFWHLCNCKNCTPWPWPIFEGQHFKMLTSLKLWELAQNMYGTTFKECDICKRMIPLRKLHLIPWPIFVQGRKSDILISRKQRELTQHVKWL